MEVSPISSTKANNDILNYQLAKVLEDEAFSVLQVIQQTSSLRKVSLSPYKRRKKCRHTGCDQEINTLLQLFSFRSAVGSSHDDTVSLGVLVKQLAGHTPNLKCQFSVTLSARPRYRVGMSYLTWWGTK
jgi:hypothetical protein